MKKILCLGFGAAGLLLVFSHPALVAGGCARGLTLWYTSVLPSLLPFLILSGLLIRSGMFRVLNRICAPVFTKCFRISEAGSYAVLTGFLCGYPMGAKVCADLVREGHVSEAEGRYLLGFCNNVSPAFFLNYICAEQLGYETPPWGLFLSFYLIPLLYGLLSRPFCRFTPQKAYKKQAVRRMDFSVLDACIMDGFAAVTRLGGYIILFTVSVRFLELLPLPDPLSALLNTALEVSSGIHHICSVQSFSQSWRTALSCAGAALGGLCIYAQTQSMLTGSSLRIQDWVRGRLAITLPVLLLTYLYPSAAQALPGCW